MHRSSSRAVLSVGVTLALLLGSILIGNNATSAAPLRQGARSTLQTATDFAWTKVPSDQIAVVAGASATVSGLELTNQSDTKGTFDLSIEDLPDNTSYDIAPGKSLTISSWNSFSVSLRITIPAGTSPGTITIRVVATKSETGTQAVAFVTLVITSSLPTPTPTGCPRSHDPGNTFGKASLIRVDLEETHGICKTGDEDWFAFAGVGGKRYMIDIPRMDQGLDLALQLYDDQHNLLDANDDYPLRGPTPSYTDTRPMINGFLAPRDGFYMIRVYDTLGIGGANLSYKIIVRSEGYASPPIVPSLCNDRYEPDGLPDQAQMFLSNDKQLGHHFCPAGDADWVKFFASKELVYYLYTDTQTANGGKPQPGADTMLYLFSRDGVTLIDANNNISGANTLDSQVIFTPPADGVYYAQIKNNGDIGSNFITYDLYLNACIHDTYCGSSLVQPTPAPTEAPPPAAPSPQADATEFVLSAPTPEAAGQ